MPILVEDSAETIQSEYREAFDPLRSRGLRPGSQGRCCRESPVGAVPVVVPLILAQRFPEVGLVPDQRAVRELSAQRLDPAFHDRVHAGHPDTGQDRHDPGAADDVVDQCRVLAVTITDEKPDLCEDAGVLEVHQKISDGPRHPRVYRMRGGTENAHTPTGMVNSGENVLACTDQRDSLDEIQALDADSPGRGDASPGHDTTATPYPD